MENPLIRNLPRIPVLFDHVFPREAFEGFFDEFWRGFSFQFSFVGGAGNERTEDCSAGLAQGAGELRLLHVVLAAARGVFGRFFDMRTVIHEC